MASVQIVLDEERTKKLYRILIPAFIEIIKQRKAEAAKSTEEHTA